MPGGIDAGVDAMLSILTGDAEEWHRRAEVREDDTTGFDPVVAFIILLILFILISRLMGAGRGRSVRARAPRAVDHPDGRRLVRRRRRVVRRGRLLGGGGSSGGGGASGSW